MEHDTRQGTPQAPVRVVCITSQAASLTNVRPEAEWFIGVARAGLDVTVMTEAGSIYADRMRAAGIRVVELTIRRKYEWRVIRRIRAELRERPADVLHLFNNKAIANGIVAAMGLPVAVVTYRGQTGNVRRYDPTCYLTHLNPRVSKITCVAEAVRRDLIANGVPRDKVVTIYKGHDPAWYRDVTPAARGALGIPDGAFVIALVANNRPRKGVPVLLESARYLPADTPLHFLLVGAGMDDDAIRDQVAAGPLADRYHLLGYRDDVLGLVAACDGAVLPAIRREGLPKTVIEAMALGLPVVVTRTGGSPELIVDGECGYVVEPGDPRGLAAALQRLADDPEHARAMGANARARLAGRFGVAQGVASLVSLYTELAARATEHAGD
jgi:glycosyltransferase involved in cell wall biosynthesis